MVVALLPQEAVGVDVVFYDDTERDKLLRYSTAERMRQLVEKPLDVPIAEFLTYYLFHRRRPGMPGYRNYQEIGAKLGVALATLDGFVTFSGHSIRTADGVGRQLTEISEHVGEAIGLSVVARLHGLTEADWNGIPPQGGRNAAPTFDYELASDGVAFVQVENKGSAVDDNRQRDERIREQYRKILVKKKKLETLGNDGRDPHPAIVRYGTIVAVDPREDGNVRCWLTDPPPDRENGTPDRFRLLQRMRFLRDWVSAISARSQLAAALSTRVSDLENITNPFELSGVPLRRGNGEPFLFGREHPADLFFARKSRVVDGAGGGEVARLSDDALLFFGFREELLLLASEQEFERVAAYAREPRSVRGNVECVVSKSRLGSLRLPTSLSIEEHELGRSVKFALSGELHYSSFGLVFGILPIPR